MMQSSASIGKWIFLGLWQPIRIRRPPQARVSSTGAMRFTWLKPSMSLRRPEPRSRGHAIPFFRLPREICNNLYPSSTASGVPQYFGRVTQSTAVLAPYRDQAYMLEVTGTQRPTPLSATNTTTFISTYLPDLLIAASMIYASGYMQNFGAMGSAHNPAMATDWNGHYKDVLQSAQTEEARKKFESEGWSPKNPSRLATPPRT